MRIHLSRLLLIKTVVTIFISIIVVHAKGSWFLWYLNNIRLGLSPQCALYLVWHAMSIRKYHWWRNTPITTGCINTLVCQERVLFSMQSEQTVRRKQLTINFLTYIKPCLVHISWYIHCILVWITVETLENLTSHDLNNFGYSFKDKLRFFSPKCKMKLTLNTDISIYLPPYSNDRLIYRKAITIIKIYETLETLETKQA